jgi:hypothetical protein
VITALSSSTSSSRRTALSDSVKPCAPIQSNTHDGHCTAGSDWVHTSPHICGQCGGPALSLARELLRAPIAGVVARSMPGLSPRKPRRWQITINVTTPVAASNSCNNGMELASKHNVQPSITHRHSLGERYPQQWHGIGLNNATSNLAEPLTAMSSGNSNNRRKTLTTKHRKVNL